MDLLHNKLYWHKIFKIFYMIFTHFESNNHSYFILKKIYFYFKEKKEMNWAGIEWDGMEWDEMKLKN